MGRFSSRLGYVAAVCLVAAFCCVPWLVPSLVWCGWLGLAAALTLAVRLPWRAGLVCTLTACAIAIILAFYWAPQVLAQTMHAPYGWGVVVFVPLAVWESARAALPFWLAARMAHGSPARADGGPALASSLVPPYALSAASMAWLPAALVAVVLESVLPSVFPWRFGQMQVAWPVTIQAVDLLGTEWATVMQFAHAGAVLCVTAASVDALRFRRLRAPLGSVLRSPAVWLSALNLLYGAAAMSYWDRQVQLAPPLRVALVQVDPTYLGSSDKLLNLTRSVSGKVDLVCWPESSGGNYHVDLERLSDAERVFELSRDPQRGLRPWPQPSCPLLLGSQTFSGDARNPAELYQSAIMLDREERIVGRYYKRLLMPFGEYVPAKDWLPFLGRLFPLSETILRGREATVLPVGDSVRLGVMLCYEDMHPETARSLVANSANLLCSLINGASFGNRLTLRQHRQLAQLRAVECRRYLVRASSTGETCVISPVGRLEARLPLQTSDVLTAQVALLDARTLASRIGNLFPWVCFLLLAVVCVTRIPLRNPWS
ncbi:MAG TPA: apolipoprotein N-acyltransferase [Pirellulales bacterium]|nr:apolipoprotein N-acyltransferase [Pirellulales bacterium]